MCLGIPGKLVEVQEPTKGFASLRKGVVDFGGVRKEVCLSCLPEAAVDDYVIVHVGFAISRVDPAEAERVFSYLREIGEIEEAAQEDVCEEGLREVPG